MMVQLPPRFHKGLVDTALPPADRYDRRRAVPHTQNLACTTDCQKMKAEEVFYEIQLTPARDRLWLHCSDGSTVGRFSAFGVDLHNSITEQMAGASECRLCTHSKPSPADWEMFRSKCKEWWDVDVPEDAISPDILTGGDHE